MNSCMVKVRFAPSPTGSLHIGGVRTALFNYLFARQAGGKFLLRIEDTDRERSRPEFEKEILESLEWLGLEWDGEVVRQSERLKSYQSCVKVLLDQGVAYQSEGAIKFRIPKQKIRFLDLVHGAIEFDSETFDDFVIQKTNGFPTYNFACVVDDHEYGMTHLIRGDDHLSNTPRQILFYQALGWEAPSFAHLPLVLGKSGEPLSKRDGEVNLNFYRDSGFIPEGILNYLALLGWSPGGNHEFFKRSELIKQFSLARVNKTSATFDTEKMKWVNGEHLRALPEEEFIKQGEAYLSARVPMEKKLSNEVLTEIILLFRSRIRIWSDLTWQAKYFWEEKIDYEPDAIEEHCRDPKVPERLSELARTLASLATFSEINVIEQCLRSLAEKLQIPAKLLIHPTRIALTGRSVSPSLFEVMRLLGKPLVLERLQKAVTQFSKRVSI
ncbi:MAG: glutamate--tRNA ligase [Candidatus Omnitrophica bacterium]|nr:glutamate--tRNA ligase [Candidatus Omnitrophota bacterium]